MPNSLTYNDLPVPGVCGFTVNDRIVGGRTTEINEYSWLVLLEYSKRNRYKITYLFTFVCMIQY